MVRASQSFREDIPLDEVKIDSSGLFSFFLQLPLIFSTFDTEIILTAILIDKRRRHVMLSDFEKLFPPLQQQTTLGSATEFIEQERHYGEPMHRRSVDQRSSNQHTHNQDSQHNTISNYGASRRNSINQNPSI